MPITHAYTSTKTDPVDSTAIGKTKWNAAHIGSPIQPARPRWGLNIPISQLGTETHASHIAVAQSVGAGVGRLNVGWNTTEPVSQGNFVWNAYLDQGVDAMVAAGIEPLGVLLGSPQWASGSADAFVVPGTAVDATYLAWEAKFLTWVAVVVARYKDRVHMWEVWNEWNDEWFWKPDADQAQYFHLYVATRTAILAVDPSAQVAVGGFTVATGGNGIWMKDWLPAMYAADIYPDYLAIHPYTGHGDDPPWEDNGMYEANFGDIQRCRDYQIAEGGAALVPIWVTEWGWDTGNVSEALQAQYVAWSMRRIRDTYSYVTVACLFADVDGGGADEYGLYHSSAYIATTVKPAAYAFKNVVTYG
jgi:hypothetical protein